MAHFDETSGVVSCITPWGSWHQTMDDVTVMVKVEEGTVSKQIKCDIKNKRLKLMVKGEIIIEGDFPSTIHAEDSTWTLEDRKLIRLTLPKVDRTAGNTWKSLLVGQYRADLLQVDEMQKKMTLQRMQYENPGMDFSGADISGNYQGGGPSLPTS